MSVGFNLIGVYDRARGWRQKGRVLPIRCFPVLIITTSAYTNEE